jgi:hypothetical protein
LDHQELLIQLATPENYENTNLEIQAWTMEKEAASRKPHHKLVYSKEANVIIIMTSSLLLGAY